MSNTKSPDGNFAVENQPSVQITNDLNTGEKAYYVGEDITDNNQKILSPNGKFRLEDGNMWMEKDNNMIPKTDGGGSPYLNQDGILYLNGKVDSLDNQPSPIEYIEGKLNPNIFHNLLKIYPDMEGYSYIYDNIYVKDRKYYIRSLRYDGKKLHLTFTCKGDLPVYTKEYKISPNGEIVTINENMFRVQNLQKVLPEEGSEFLNKLGVLYLKRENRYDVAPLDQQPSPIEFIQMRVPEELFHNLLLEPLKVEMQNYKVVNNEPFLIRKLRYEGNKLKGDFVRDPSIKTTKKLPLNYDEFTKNDTSISNQILMKREDSKLRAQNEPQPSTSSSTFSGPSFGSKAKIKHKSDLNSQTTSELLPIEKRYLEKKNLYLKKKQLLINQIVSDAFKEQNKPPLDVTRDSEYVKKLSGNLKNEEFLSELNNSRETSSVEEKNMEQKELFSNKEVANTKRTVPTVEKTTKQEEVVGDSEVLKNPSTEQLESNNSREQSITEEENMEEVFSNAELPDTTNVKRKVQKTTTEEEFIEFGSDSQVKKKTLNEEILSQPNKSREQSSAEEENMEEVFSNAELPGTRNLKRKVEKTTTEEEFIEFGSDSQVKKKTLNEEILSQLNNSRELSQEENGKSADDMTELQNNNSPGAGTLSTDIEMSESPNTNSQNTGLSLNNPPLSLEQLQQSLKDQYAKTRQTELDALIAKINAEQQVDASVTFSENEKSQDQGSQHENTGTKTRQTELDALNEKSQDQGSQQQSSGSKPLSLTSLTLNTDISKLHDTNLEFEVIKLLTELKGIKTNINDVHIPSTWSLDRLLTLQKKLTAKGAYEKNVEIFPIVVSSIVTSISGLLKKDGKLRELVAEDARILGDRRDGDALKNKSVQELVIMKKRIASSSTKKTFLRFQSEIRLINATINIFNLTSRLEYGGNVFDLDLINFTKNPNLIQELDELIKNKLIKIVKL
jgi:hypothetical protein